MGYPELDHDESIILETGDIKFKSISFDAILTNKRIILTDSKKKVIPPQNILLSSIRNIEVGENAIRDHFLILSISSETGEKQHKVLTFVRQAGGERKRECSDWAKKLKSLLTIPTQDTTPSIIPVSNEIQKTKGEVPRLVQSSTATTRPAKKKIETALPLHKITEKTPVAPVPKETSSLPSGSFCSRCGNRVPFKSTFCNHCGTPIEDSSQRTSVSQPVITSQTVPPPSPPSVIIETPVTVPPSTGLRREHKTTQIEEIIHTIEPLIEDSVPRAQQPAPLVQKHDYQQKSEPVTSEPPGGSPSQVLWPVLPTAESPLAAAGESGAGEPESPPPQPFSGTSGKKPNYLAIGILIIAILPILAGIVIVANIMSGPSGGSETPTLVTTLMTTLPTPLPQTTQIPVVTSTIPSEITQVIIPPNGVWVRASYPGTYIGLIGTPGNQLEVSGSGDKFYPISTTDGIVAAALQKKDGSGDKIILEVYKNGVLLKRESTVTPKGIVEIQLDLKTLAGTANPPSSH